MGRERKEYVSPAYPSVTKENTKETSNEYLELLIEEGRLCNRPTFKVGRRKGKGSERLHYLLMRKHAQTSALSDNPLSLFPHLRSILTSTLTFP